MKVGRASLHSIVMPHRQWGADTGNVIGKMSGESDRFSVNCYVIRSVINPSETTACSPPDRPTSGEVYTPNADTVHIMLMWFCPSSEIYYICTEDAVALAVKLLLHDVYSIPAESQVPIRQKLRTKANSKIRWFALSENTWNFFHGHNPHSRLNVWCVQIFYSAAAAAAAL